MMKIIRVNVMDEKKVIINRDINIRETRDINKGRNSKE